MLQHVGLEFLEVRRVQVLLGGLAGLPLCRATGKRSTYNVGTYNVPTYMCCSTLYCILFNIILCSNV